MRRHYNYVPDRMERIFDVLRPYRKENTSGFFGDDDLMFVPLKSKWWITFARDGRQLRVQITFDGSPVSDIETVDYADQNRIQELLYAHAIE